MAWGVGRGDAVFVPSFTFAATAEVVPWFDAEPVFVDVDADTYNMDPTALERAIEGIKAEGRLTPRVVIAVDLVRPAGRLSGDQGRLRQAWSEADLGFGAGLRLHHRRRPSG